MDLRRLRLGSPHENDRNTTRQNLWARRSHNQTNVVEVSAIDSQAVFHPRKEPQLEPGHASAENKFSVCHHNDERRIHTMVKFWSLMSLYTLIHVTSPSGMRNSGPGIESFTRVVRRWMPPMLISCAVTRRIASGANVSSCFCLAAALENNKLNHNKQK